MKGSGAVAGAEHRMRGVGNGWKRAASWATWVVSVRSKVRKERRAKPLKGLGPFPKGDWGRGHTDYEGNKKGSDRRVAVATGGSGGQTAGPWGVWGTEGGKGEGEGGPGRGMVEDGGRGIPAVRGIGGGEGRKGGPVHGLVGKGQERGSGVAGFVCPFT